MAGKRIVITQKNRQLFNSSSYYDYCDYNKHATFILPFKLLTMEILLTVFVQTYIFPHKRFQASAVCLYFYKPFKKDYWLEGGLFYLATFLLAMIILSQTLWYHLSQ